ncbi:MAG: type IV toxin-antitoxin system AbiEi family antitoxin domain-containing protein [Spirochaetaceae bacterium]|nr:type IV toxin-antitoxin system AbiEi family antitoxin domain-containing protein [Spirochaetaceae bacterium]
MQSISLLKNTLEQNADSSHFLFSTQDFSPIFPDFTIENLRMLLSRATKSGILERVCKGIYLYPKSGFDSSLVLFKTASKLRADCLNYLSLETVLSQEGIISQQLLGWITIMTTGRSGTIDCGHFGTVEFIHTAKSQERITSHLQLDAQTGMWRADKELALQDMKDAKRKMDLVNYKL